MNGAPSRSYLILFYIIGGGKSMCYLLLQADFSFTVSGIKYTNLMNTAGQYIWASIWPNMSRDFLMYFSTNIKTQTKLFSM